MLDLGNDAGSHIWLSDFATWLSDLDAWLSDFNLSVSVLNGWLSDFIQHTYEIRQPTVENRQSFVELRH